MIFNRLLFLGMIFLLAACGTPEASTPGPTPVATNIIYPAALQTWADKLASCASAVPQVALYFTQTTNSDIKITPGDIVLSLGQHSNEETGKFLFQVGWEQLVVIVNQANPIIQLTSDELRQIFSGQVANWDNGSGFPIGVWILPEGEPTRQIFDTTLQLTQLLAPDAMLAPDPNAMLESISKEEEAIGYLPLSLLKNSSSSGDIKIVQLDTSLQQELHQPVIAITQSEPKGYMRDLLVCLQNTMP